SIFGANPLFFHGSEKQLEKYLPDVANGSLHVSFGITEQNVGSDTTQIETFAKKENSGYTINGQKVFITKAKEADRILLIARTTISDNVDKKIKGMSIYFAPIDTTFITFSIFYN